MDAKVSTIRLRRFKILTKTVLYMRKYSRLHTCNLNFRGLKCIHKLHIIMIRLSIFCKKVLEIPQSKIGNFWLQGFSWHQNIWGFETSMQKWSSQIMQIGHSWNSNKRNGHEIDLLIDSLILLYPSILQIQLFPNKVSGILKKVELFQFFRENDTNIFSILNLCQNKKC